jgi:hypothetical protein
LCLFLTSGPRQWQKLVVLRAVSLRNRQLIRLTKIGAKRACTGTTKKRRCPAPAATPSKALLCLDNFDLWLGNAAPTEVPCAAGTCQASPALLQPTGPRAARLAHPYSQRLLRRSLGLRCETTVPARPLMARSAGDSTTQPWPPPSLGPAVRGCSRGRTWV